MAGGWQHYLPASYLSGFSGQVRRPARASLIWVARRGVQGAFIQKVGNIGAARDLYTLRRGPWAAEAVDDVWWGTEARLPWAIDHFLKPHNYVDALLWSVVLVRFVAQIFVRGVDFEARYRARLAKQRPELGEIFGEPDSDAINNLRLIEMNRVIGGVMCAEWSVCYAPPGEYFIANDIGRTHLVRDKSSGGLEMCALIPLRRDAALCVAYEGRVPTPRPTSADTWGVGPIRRWTLPKSEMQFLNNRLANDAWDEFYGEPKEFIEALHATRTTARPELHVLETFFQTRPFELRNLESLWPQFYDFIQTPPSRTTRPFVHVPFGGGLAVYEFGKGDETAKPTIQIAMVTAVTQGWRVAEKHRADLLGIPIGDSRYPVASMALTKMAVIESGRRDPRYGSTVVDQFLEHMRDLGLLHAESRCVEPPVMAVPAEDEDATLPL